MILVMKSPDLLAPFLHHSYLLSQLVQREIKARYKQSILGYFWVLLSPLMQLLVYTFVFSIVFRFQSADVPYPLFLLAALLPWNFLQNSVNASTVTLIENAPLLRKIAFPREVIPYSVIAAKLIDLAVAGLVFAGLFLYFQQPWRWEILWILPLLGLQILLVTGVSLLFSAANLFYRDIQYLGNLILILWLYLSPIVYPLALVPEKYLWWYQLNPLVGIFEGYRWALFGLPVASETIAWSGLASVSIFALCWIIFKKMERVFADIV